MPTLDEIVTEVDRRAPAHGIGRLQDLRKLLRPLKRKPTQKVFAWARDSTWAFHVGGRDELQFNLGIEEPFAQGDFRYGVAFSFKLSMSLPTIDPLVPKVALFNDYLREHLDVLSDLWMWHHADGGRSRLRRPAAIEPELVQPEVFVFMGAIGSTAAPDYDDVLRTLDRLLPLWTFIEERAAGIEPPVLGRWEVKPGLPARAHRTWRSLAEQTLAVDLRHGALQEALYRDLVEEMGFENVGVEHWAPGGGIVDVVANAAGGLMLFEIKTASTARGCVREAVGQLLDYGCWPGVPSPTGLCVVGEPELDAATARYIEGLNRNFPVPLTYRRVRLT